MTRLRAIKSRRLPDDKFPLREYSMEHATCTASMLRVLGVCYRYVVRLRIHVLKEKLAESFHHVHPIV